MVLNAHCTFFPLVFEVFGHAHEAFESFCRVMTKNVIPSLRNTFTKQLIAAATTAIQVGNAKLLLNAQCRLSRDRSFFHWPIVGL